MGSAHRTRHGGEAAASRWRSLLALSCLCAAACTTGFERHECSTLEHGTTREVVEDEHGSPCLCRGHECHYPGSAERCKWCTCIIEYDDQWNVDFAGFECGFCGGDPEETANAAPRCW